MAELAALRSAQRLALITQKASTVVPTNAVAVSVPATSGTFTAAAFGLWTTIQSSGTLTGHALTMVCASAASVSQNFQMQIGSGAAGSEVVIADIAYAVPPSLGTLYELITPAVTIPANERVAMRMVALSTAAGTVSVYIGATPRPF